MSNKIEPTPTPTPTTTPTFPSPTDSILGKDPEPTPTPTPTPTTTPTPTVTSLQQGGDLVQISKEELEGLRDGANSYTQLMESPEIVSMIHEHLRDTLGGVTADPTVVNPQQAAQAVQPGGETTLETLAAQQNQIIEHLRQGAAALQVTQREVARMKLESFEAGNKDFAGVKQEVVSMMRKHPTLQLQDALSLVMAGKGAPVTTQNGLPSESTPTPVVEGRTTGAGPVDDSDPRTAALKAIDAAGDIDQAVDIALRTAQQIHGG